MLGNQSKMAKFRYSLFRNKQFDLRLEPSHFSLQQKNSELSVKRNATILYGIKDIYIFCGALMSIDELHFSIFGPRCAIACGTHAYMLR